jgi:hypothetical protein
VAETQLEAQLTEAQIEATRVELQRAKKKRLHPENEKTISEREKRRGNWNLDGKPCEQTPNDYLSKRGRISKPTAHFDPEIYKLKASDNIASDNIASDIIVSDKTVRKVVLQGAYVAPAGPPEVKSCTLEVPFRRPKGTPPLNCKWDEHIGEYVNYLTGEVHVKGTRTSDKQRS